MQKSETGGGIWAEFNRVWRRKRKAAAAARAAKDQKEATAAPLVPRRRRRLNFTDLLAKMMTATLVALALMSATGTAIGALFHRRPRPSAALPADPPTAPADAAESQSRKIACEVMRVAGRRRVPLIAPDSAPARALCGTAEMSRPIVTPKVKATGTDRGWKPR